MEHNFWYHVLQGVLGIALWVANGYLPDHHTMGLAMSVASMANTTLGIISVFVLELINPFWGLTVFGVIMVSEVTKTMLKIFKALLIIFAK